MADEKKENRTKELMEAMMKERGYLTPRQRYMAEKDVDFMEAYNHLYEKGLKDGKALSAKIREFVAIAILAYRGLDEAVYEHIRRALRLGATKQELLEAIETMMIPGGSPTFATALRALIRIEEEEKKAG